MKEILVEFIVMLCFCGLLMAFGLLVIGHWEAALAIFMADLPIAYLFMTRVL